MAKDGNELVNVTYRDPNRVNDRPAATKAVNK